jgi:hypothetical protein
MNVASILSAAALGAGFCAALASPAAAQANSFRDCDGFRPPSRTADGLHRRGESLFATPARFAGIDLPSRVDAQLAAKGVSACEAALASPLLLPEQNLRRASLVRARGIYRLAAGDGAAALADFAESRQVAGSADPLYLRSLGLGTDMLSAYALHLAGRKDEAVAAARAAHAARPTNAELGTAAAMLILAATGDWDAYAAASRDVARYNPPAFLGLYTVALLRGRFEEAVALQPHIVLGVPSTRDGTLVGGTAMLVAANFLTRIDIDGSAAFALAALGQRERAEAELRSLTERVDAALTEPRLPPGVTDQRSIRRELQRYRQISPHAANGRSRLASWRRMVDLQVMAANGRAAEAATQVLAEPVGATRFGLSLYEAIAAADPGSRERLEPLIAAARRNVEGQLANLARLSLPEFVRLLPEAENESRVSGYNRGSDGFLGNEGFMSREAAIPGARTVKFSTDQGTASTNSEMALLRAAEMALEQNMSGFVVLDRRVLQRTLVTSQYGAEVSRDHEGFVAEIDVVFVNRDALPAGISAAPWRYIDAEDVRARLAPVYVRRGPPATQGRRGRN